MAVTPTTAALLVAGVVLAFGAQSLLLVVWHRRGTRGDVQDPSPPAWAVLAVRVGGALLLLLGLVRLA